MSTTDKLAERAAFEAWADREGLILARHRVVGMRYVVSDTHAAWQAWQARAALEAEAKPAPAEPAWMAAFDEARDAILNDRGSLEGEAMTDTQTNAVLGILDDAFMPHLKRGAAPAAPAADRVYIPTNAEQAAGMVSVAMAWLKEHAPERLAAPAARALMLADVLAAGERGEATMVEAGNMLRALALAAPAAPAPDPEGTKCLTHEAIAAALTEGRPLNHMQRACLLGLVDADKRKQTCYDAAIQDAERYRWLRTCTNEIVAAIWHEDAEDGAYYGFTNPEALDAEIDAAIAASKKGGAA